MLIDTHTHLLHRRYNEDPAQSAEDRLAQATAAGVTHVITIACHPNEWAPHLAFAKSHPQVSVAAGIHPHDTAQSTLAAIAPSNAGAKAAGTLSTHMETLKTLTLHLVALGETGLDYYYDNSPRPDQHAAFHAHLSLAKETGLPVVIHTRDAEEDTIAILKEHPDTPFVLHCFSGTPWLADEALVLGGYLSFSGILTFKKSEELRAIATNAPRSRVMLETDAPYLAPHPHRSARNQPSLMVHTAQTLATCWDMPVTEVARQTTANAHTLFTHLPHTI